LRFRSRAIEIALLLSLADISAGAETIPEMVSAIAATTQYREATVSPDGLFATWAVTLHNKDNTQSRNSEIFLQDLTKPGTVAARISSVKGPHAEHSLAWSPDSKELAFLSDVDKPGQLQLYVQGLNGKARKLTSLTGFLASPRWSPDGSHIAVLFTEDAPRAAGPLEPSTKAAGVVDEKIYEQRIYSLDARTGEGHFVTPADTYVYEYDWSPAGDRFAYTASKGVGDNNWWIAQLFTIAASGAAAGGEPSLVYKPALQIAIPRWSPDGKQIAFISGLMSDEGSTGGDIYVVSAAGGAEAKNLTPLRHGSPSWLRWTSTNRILFSETVDGGAAIATLDTSSLQTETLWKGDESIDAGSSVVASSNDAKTVAVIRSSWTAPPAVWAGPLSQWTQRTHDNDSMKPTWGRTEKLHWASDNFNVEGWLMYPQNYDPAKKYPLVVSVHGGPAAAKRPAWPGFFDLSLLSNQGYFVFFPNPRGSFGDGETFARANVRDIGKGDLRDILLGLDQIVRTLPVDSERLGIAGWSYGGYMTMWALTQTRRFHAAVAGAGISNWQSYYGENLIDRWMIPYFGASVYDSPAIYARSSPIDAIRNVKTPALIVVGDSDAECPAPQSYEYWHALRTLGVKTQLVVYPGEGHRIQKPEHTKDLMERTMGWFNDNLLPQSTH
jgi:dipeptidyl aminopeptidase/acylaminoacyl peptidase